MNPPNLPNYFLADLPPEATLSPGMLAEACQTLKRNRAQYLAHRSTDSMIRVLSAVAEGWLKPDNTFRKLALEIGPAETGFSVETLKRGLEGFFGQMTRENLQALLVQELGDADYVAGDGRREPTFSRDPSPVTRHFWSGPEFLVHIAAGNIPNPTWAGVALGLLARSAQLVKCASGSAFLPRLFAHSLYEADPKLGACLEIAEWRGGSVALEEVLFGEADCVTATGSDEALAAVRSRLPVKTRFLGYGHRVSFGFVTREVLTRSGASRIVARAADDVVAWNQLGCLSPHVIYAQPGGEVPPDQFAELLAEELERREQTEPRGELPTLHAAAIASRRAIYEVRAAHSPETQMWHSRETTAWTVVFEADPRFQVSCLNRFIYVKPVKDLTELLQHVEVVRGMVSTVGIAAAEHQTEELAVQLARWGVTRVCPLGRMQNPPLTWRHDGRPTLGDLVTWAEWEY
ncbi:MAG TPA: acyl-CoA reductase [Candidatus Sulfopaludibacter sp.]|nr:acyl-CoA reductase [Candidatus Sulfopaludibacter sp.]